MLIFCLHGGGGVQEGKWQKVERRITDRGSYQQVTFPEIAMM